MGRAYGAGQDCRTTTLCGTAGLASYLFATKEGHILFNTGMPESGPLIVDSIRTLGFDPKDIKVLINGHGHIDHAGAFAYFKKLTGAQIAIMEPDVAIIEDGGRATSTTVATGRSWARPRSRSIACCATAIPFG